jgi:hypothetical protein
VERRHPRAVFGPTVPPAIVERVGHQAFDDAVDGLAEVGADRQREPVNARLGLALEVGRVVRVPPDVLAREGDGAACLGAVGVQTEVAQEHERVVRRRPCVEERLRLIDPSWPVGPAVPSAVDALQREQLCAPALDRDACALGGNLGGSGVGEVAHHLPADRGIGVQQPIDDRHGSANIPQRPDTV